MLVLSAFLFASAAHSAHLAHQHQGSPTQVVWAGYGGNAQHSAISNYSPTGYGEIVYSLSQDATNEDNIIHYGSSSLTAHTIVYPYRMANGDFEFIGRNITNGAVLWSYISDFQFPSPSEYGWIPPVSGTLLPDGTYVGPRIAGGVFSRPSTDSESEFAQEYFPCGVDQLVDNYSVYTSSVFIVTPITADASGNVYYGIRVYGDVPDGMSSCFVKMTESGRYSFYMCPSGYEPSYNAGPAVSPDGTKVYVAETNNSAAYLVELSTSTMQEVNQVLLVDPLNGLNAQTIPESTASPLVGPDGDVYFGVMGNPFWDHGDRGFLLHFTSSLVPKGVPGAFGWDDTPSIVPVSAVPSYTGSASYLLFCKYNNYADGLGGQGNNMVAVLDPTASYTEPIYGLQCMNPVFEVLGVTLDPANTAQFPNAVKEWCINSAAVDVNGKTVVVNSEDGNVYELSLITGTLVKHIRITGGASEAYTSTIIAADGTVFGVSEAKIFAIRGAPHVIADNSRPRAGAKKGKIVAKR